MRADGVSGRRAWNSMQAVPGGLSLHAPDFSSGVLKIKGNRQAACLESQAIDLQLSEMTKTRRRSHGVTRCARQFGFRFSAAAESLMPKGLAQNTG